MRLANRLVGAGKPALVIAEAGVNHNGDVEVAKRLVDAAARAGADAVKFQTFRARCLASKFAPLAPYQRDGQTVANTQYAMLEALELSPEAHYDLKSLCDRRGITFLSSPFDEKSADLLESIGVCAFKIASGELTNHPLLAHIARKAKPIILSTGMATFAEIAAALAVMEEAGANEIALLHAVSAYPTPIEEVNLRAIQSLRTVFGRPVGFSDHTCGFDIAPVAVALGACIVEKHFTLDRSFAGPDHSFSVEPAELAAMISGIRRVEAAMGDGQKRVTPSEREVANCARKSLIAARSLRAGEILRADCLVALRPGTGIPPSALPTVIGRRLNRDLLEGSLLAADDLS